MRTSRSAHRSMVAGFVVAAVGVAGCSGSNSGVTSGSDSANTSAGTVAVVSSQPAATVLPGTSPATTAPPSTAPPSTAPPSTPVPSTGPALPAVDAGGCALTAPREGTGSITYVVDGQLLELSPNGQSATCLADLTGPLSGPVTWSPTGDRALLGSDTVLDANGVRATGFDAANTGVSWSYPTGKALIAPDQADGGLTWHNSRDGNDQLDISFLQRTDVAVYHPDGKNIVAAGVGLDGVPGLYLASNRGANARVITTLDDPSTSITEIAVDSDGQMLYFVHDHGDVQHIHWLLLQGLYLSDVATSTDPIGSLTLGPERSSYLAYREGDCAGIVTTKIVDEWVDPSAAPGLDGRSVSPIGWLNEDHLIVAVRDRGCDGPAEVWVIPRSSRVARQVLPEVEAVSVRTVLSAWGELPDDINAQAPT